MSPSHRIFLGSCLLFLFLFALSGCSNEPYPSPADDDDSASDDDDAASDDDDAAGDDDDAAGDDDDAAGDDDDAAGDDDDAAGDDDDAAGDDDDAAGDDDDAAGDDDDASTDFEPELAGAFTWSQQSLSSVTGELFLPDGPGPFPAVILSPGFQLGPADYQSYGEHFASWGYITLLLQFPGGLLETPTHLELSEFLSDAIDWVESNPAELGGSYAAGQLVLAGHSLGGKISLLSAATDGRALAVVGIDPVDSGPPFGGNPTDYPSVAPELMSTISAPILLFGEMNNSTGSFITPACAPADENFQQYYGAATSPVLEVDVLDAFHMSFLDNPGCLVCFACPAGTDNPVVTKALTQAYMTAFLEAELRQDASAEGWLSLSDPGGYGGQGLVSTRSKNGF